MSKQLLLLLEHLQFFLRNKKKFQKRKKHDFAKNLRSQSHVMGLVCPLKAEKFRSIDRVLLKIFEVN